MGQPLIKDDFTYQDYLKLNDEKRYEIIYGELIMVPAPSWKHQSAQSNLGRIFSIFVQNNKLGKVRFAPLDVVLSATNVVQPDILFISDENKGIVQDRGVFGSPDMVVEIISPTSLKRDLEDKRYIYENSGIKEYWLVFPSEKVVEVLVLNEHGKYEVYDFGGLEQEEKKVKSKVLDGLEVSLTELFDF